MFGDAAVRVSALVVQIQPERDPQLGLPTIQVDQLRADERAERLRGEDAPARVELGAHLPLPCC